VIQKQNFAEIMAAWAARQPSVKALVLFGSQVRESNDPVWSADAQSDWDFQIITSNSRAFFDAAWLGEVTEMKVKAYVVRAPRFGAMPKINTVLGGVEADFVIFPSRVMSLAKFAVKLGLHRRTGRVRRGLQDLSIVMRPGYRFLKGGKTWEPFYRKVINDVPDPRLGDLEIRNLADSFVCDYHWAIRKLERGELLAVQRILHRELAEINYRMLHELKLRRGEQSFPEARRIERVTTPEELRCVSINAELKFDALQAALALSAETLAALVKSLLDDAWKWPSI